MYNLHFALLLYPESKKFESCNLVATIPRFHRNHLGGDVREWQNLLLFFLMVQLPACSNPFSTEQMGPHRAGGRVGARFVALFWLIGLSTKSQDGWVDG